MTSRHAKLETRLRGIAAARAIVELRRRRAGERRTARVKSREQPSARFASVEPVPGRESRVSGPCRARSGARRRAFLTRRGVLSENELCDAAGLGARAVAGRAVGVCRAGGRVLGPMACVNAPASVHAATRVVAKASSSAGRRARADGILAASHRRRGAVRTPARWTAAAAFRGVHLFERRAPARRVCFAIPRTRTSGRTTSWTRWPREPRATYGGVRRRPPPPWIPSGSGSPRDAPSPATKPNRAIHRAAAEIGLAEAKSTMRAMRQTQAVQTQARRAKTKTPARRDATESRARSKSGDAKEPAKEPEPVAPRPGPARAPPTRRSSVCRSTLTALRRTSRRARTSRRSRRASLRGRL